MSKILVDYISVEDGVRLAPANRGRQQLTTASNRPFRTFFSHKFETDLTRQQADAL